jgi:hypothetical protein
LDLGVAIEDERLNFAAAMVIGRWFERFGAIISSVNLRLMSSLDETMLTRNWSQGKVTVALDQRVFRKKCKKPHHYTLGVVFSPFGHRSSPLTVIPRFSGAEELFMGRDELVREFRTGWCTVPIFAAFAEHFCGWLTDCCARIGVAPSA